jgi:hypothetical protein
LYHAVWRDPFVRLAGLDINEADVIDVLGADGIVNPEASSGMRVPLQNRQWYTKVWMLDGTFRALGQSLRAVTVS